MLAERIDGDWRRLARRWTLNSCLAQDIVLLDQWATAELSAAGVRWGGLLLISGRRTPAEQAKINPFFPGSLHVRCPSMAVDLRLGNRGTVVKEFADWNFLGQRWEFMGHRWGGRFKPPDPNHFDLGVTLTGEREIKEFAIPVGKDVFR